MPPTAAKRRAAKKEPSNDDQEQTQPSRSGLTRRQRTQRIRLSGCLLFVVLIIMFFVWNMLQESRREALEFARVVACGWQECADPAKASVLEAVADMASKQKTNMERELSPQRAMWSFCLKTCIDAPEKTASASVMAQVEKVLDAAEAQRTDCAHEASWTLDVTLLKDEMASLTDLIDHVARKLVRCGLVRLVGLWEESDFTWMTTALDMYKSLGPEQLYDFGRVEVAPRRTEDVLVPLGWSLSSDVWKGLARLLSQPIIVGAIAKHFNSSGLPRLSYASWIAAPPAKSSKSTMQHQKIHSDLDSPSSMVSVHLALEDVTTSMGPTGYCPGTHRPGANTTTDSAGLAGPLELHFARRYVALSKETEPCTPIVPANTRKGTVTIYDSALVHRGEANKADRPRVLLNLNIASGQQAIDEENYIAYFNRKSSQKAVRLHLDRIRKFFDVDFFKSIVRLGMEDGGLQAHRDGESLALRQLDQLERLTEPK